jgi:hypothetical protein
MLVMFKAQLTKFLEETAVFFNSETLCKVSGSYGGGDEGNCLLGYCAM